MSHIVDSDAIINWLNGSVSGRALLDPLLDDGFAISVISLMEIEDGVQPGDVESRSAFEEIKVHMRILPVEEQTALIASTIRRHLRAR